MPALTLLLTCFALAHPSKFEKAQAGLNLVPNPSFSNGGATPDSWTQKTESTGHLQVTRDSSVYKSGPASLCLSTVGGIGDGNVYTPLPAIGGKTVTVQGFIRSSSPQVQDAQIAVLCQDSNYKMVSWSPAALRYDFKDGVWSEFKKVLAIPPQTAHALLIVLLKGEGKVWVDDLSITDATKPIVPTGTKSNFVDILPVTDRIIAVHFKDGKVNHHKIGQKRGDDQVIQDPLDIATATTTQTYKLTSDSDKDCKPGQRPVSIGRKSKGADFAWFTDRWVGDHFENDRPDHIDEHWIFLTLPKALKPSNTYKLSLGGLAKNATETEFTFDPRKLRSDSVHVNLIGYVPSAKLKFGYVYQWMGDQGGLDVQALKDRKFWLVDTKTSENAFEGKVEFRSAKSTVETGQLTDTPEGNFQAADVSQCDFSSFTKPGKYVLAVEGVGCSFPFKIDADVYREPFQTTVRGLYHNRSGIALTAPYTKWTRPAPHNPKLTPGFAGKLKYTTSRFIDWKDWDNSPADKPAIEAGIKGPLDAWGWYQDAGDWDSYYTHLHVAQDLLLAYQMAPQNFKPGELNIPESKNGLPDILNEAAWLPRFGYRLRQELIKKGYGTGGVGLRVCGDHFGGDTGPQDVGRGSWQDVDRTWIVSGEDPLSTYIYSAVAAQLYTCLKIAGKPDPEGVDWLQEAKQSYAWAKANTRSGDIAKPEVLEKRIAATAALFVATGDKSYESQFMNDTKNIGPSSLLSFGALYGPAVYSLGNGSAVADADTLERIQKAVLFTADGELDASKKRALRWGGDWGMPMLIGHQTTPWVQALAVATTLTRKTDPIKSGDYRAALYTTCDYFLGTNGLNQTWVTGLGPQHPNAVFHMDSWYSGQAEPIPGIIPYGPWRKDKDQGPGPWDKDWANKSAYPNIDYWPGNERWFNNRCSPMSSEFTIHQNTGPAAAIFGFLCSAK